MKLDFFSLTRSICASLLLGYLCFGHAAETVHVTLLQVNDVYQATPVDKGKRGGLARVATLKKNIASENPNTLLVFGGDTLSPSVASSIFKGRQMIAAWNALGVDYAVLGNHEFDFGSETLRERLAESRFPWLAANVVDRASGNSFAAMPRYVIRQFGGVKVGFFGLLTADTATTSKPGKEVAFHDPIRIARRVVAELRAKGVKTVVALTHLSMSEDKRLAQAVPVDVILGGHEHAVMQSLAGRTPIFKMGSDARTLGRIDLILSTRTGKLDSVDWDLLPVTQETPSDPTAAAVIDQFEQRLAGELDQQVGRTEVPLDARQEANRSRETNLGSFIADVYRRQTGADVALLNGGSIRSNATYGPGALTRKDILSILPFENPVVVVEADGLTLRRALEHGVSRAAEDPEDGRFLQISGLSFTFDASRPPGARIVTVTVGEQPLDDGKQYRLASNTYLLNGGDGYAMFKDARHLITAEDAQVEPAIVLGAIAAGSIAPQTDGRIKRLDKQ
jgi:5'-nucleotidase